MKTESEIQKEIGKHLVEIGYLAVRINTIVKGFLKSYWIINNGKCSGFPDIVAFKNNRFLLIEVKDHKGVQKPTQNVFQKLCEKTGNDYHIVRSLEELKELLNGLAWLNYKGQ